MLRQDGHALLGLHHRQCRVLGQELDKQARVGGIQMLDEHEGHSGRHRQSIEQLGASLEAAGGCAYRDNPHPGVAGRRALLQHGHRGAFLG